MPKNGVFLGEFCPDDIKWLADNGFDFLIGSSNDRFIALCRKYKIEPWTCLGTFNPPTKSPEYLCVSINGERKEWFSSGCPNNPDVINFSLEKFEKAAEKDVSGIFCDGIRFASPASGLEAFFTCFCKHCEKKAQEYNVDFERMKKDISTLYKRCKEGIPLIESSVSLTPSVVLSYFVSMPGVCDWLFFKKKVIADFVEKLSKIVRPKDKRLGGYFFSPCLSVFVGQDYSILSRYIDICSPMLYRNTREKGSIAPINTELQAISEWAENEKNPQWILDFTGLSSKIITKSDFLRKGISIEDTVRETLIAKHLIGKKSRLIPILWWKDTKIRKTIREVIKAGASGIQIFWYTKETRRFIKSKLKRCL
ncbi:MAG: hypothetical protein NC906_04195 [Candidatus Omnitrophica bacterium]|nr:hypothetical protein [Candidatus Omnitrophota bacterium]